MRILSSVAMMVLACGPAAAAPDGWCPRPVPAPSTPTSSFEVTADLAKVRPLRAAGFTSYEVGYPREGRPMGGMSPWLDVTAVGGKLRLSTAFRDCQTTNAGCIHGYWSTPAKVVFEDPTPVTGCISYAFQLPGGVVVGFGGDVRTYLRRGDTAAAVGPTLRAANLEPLYAQLGAVLAAERDGTLWKVAWETTPAPVLTKIGKVSGRVRSAQRENHGLLYVFTDSAMHALDEKTWVERWHVDGEIWSVMNQDVPLLHYVLGVERGATPKVVVRMLDAIGVEMRRTTVYSGPVTEAHLERSGEYVRPDRYESILVVHVTK